MARKTLLVVAATLLALVASVPRPAHAAGQWYFVSVCVVGAPVYCPWGPDPWWWGPMDSEAHCYAVRAAVETTWLGMHPRALSTCWEE